MQEHIYIAQPIRIFRQSFFIWLYLLVQIAINFFILPSLIKNHQALGILSINFILCFITIPAVIIFYKYYKLSVGKTFVISHDSVKFIDNKTKNVIQLLNSEIAEIHLVQNNSMSVLPWLFHEYFSLTDIRANKIIITSYIMEISDLWLDPLTRKISNKNLVQEQKAYPIV